MVGDLARDLARRRSRTRFVSAAPSRSTNAVIHLLAFAGRVSVDLTLRIGTLGRGVPTLLDLKPSGQF
jgi:dihydroxy-acid dehydratase